MTRCLTEGPLFCSDYTLLNGIWLSIVATSYLPIAAYSEPIEDAMKCTVPAKSSAVIQIATSCGSSKQGVDPSRLRRKAKKSYDELRPSVGHWDRNLCIVVLKK